MQHDLNAYLEGVEESDRLPLTLAIQLLQDDRRTVIPGPVSFLQRHLRLGYNTAIRLAQHLEHLQFWTMRDDAEHGRVATVEPR